MRRTAITASAWLSILVVTSWPLPVAAQQSDRFVMERVTLAAATGPTGAARFNTTAVVAPADPAGAASRCNDGYLTVTGFWSVARTAAVPLRLRLVADASDPAGVDLVWSGADPSFQVFRSPTAHDVTDPINLLTQTSDCRYTDAKAPAPGILYYRVEALP